MTQPAKPVSDMAELVRKLRSNAQVCRDEQARVDEYYKPELANNAREWDEAARTIEALQRENERLAKIEQRAKENLWDLEHQPMKTAPEIYAERLLRHILKAGIRGEDDQLQGGSDR